MRQQPDSGPTAKSVGKRKDLYQKVVMMENRATNSKTRTVFAPESTTGGSSHVFSVELDENEEVQWQWIHYPNGQSVVAGYEIVKKEEAFDIERAISDWLWERDDDKE
jgi:hypothetical protein